MNITCPYCFNIFYLPNCRINANGKNFCSRRCYNLYRKAYPELYRWAPPTCYVCYVCKKSFTKYTINKKHKHQFCSRKCYAVYKKTLKPHNCIDNQTMLEALNTVFYKTNLIYLSPSIYETNRKEQKLPSAIAIRRRFKTWKAALQSANISSES